MPALRVSVSRLSRMSPMRLAANVGRRAWLAGRLALLAAFLACSTRVAAEGPRFNRDIRPVLSDLCFQCHGPDQNQRKADLRLDDELSAIGTPDQPGVVKRGQPDSSELLRRMLSNDPAEQMPPPETGRRATAEQLAQVRAWIAAGAPWEAHWAFLPPRRPDPHPVREHGSPDAARSPLDWLVAAPLATRRLAPSPEAPPETLFRRATLDLAGLPPHPLDVDDYLAEQRPDAYQRHVERLLASPRFGERLAARWLDAARYADTSGYQSDGPRFMWRWRDWVLDAFNRDLPFDRFTVEQLAGDLLPNATLEQRIATGFNRNHRGNSEGGIIPEEFAVEYVVDRVDTTATVWLGLTVGCARCHDHKFDPVSQRDYYRLFAYFNNIPEFGRAIKEGNSPPYIAAPTPLESARLAELDRRLAAADAELARLEPSLAAAQKAWEASPPRLAAPDAPKNDAGKDAGNDAGKDGVGGVEGKEGGNVDAAFGFRAAGLVAQAALDSPMVADGAIGSATRFNGEKPVELGDIAGFSYFEAFSIGIWVRPWPDGGGTLVSKMTDAARGDGYSITLNDGKLQLNFVKRWLDDALRMESRRALEPGRWQHVLAVYDGTRTAQGVALYVDGEPWPLNTQLDALNQTFATKEPLRIGGGGGAEGRFRGELDELRIYRGALGVDDARRLAARDPLSKILEIAPERRTPGQSGKLRDFFLDRVAASEFRQAKKSRDGIAAERNRLADSVSTVMVMEELPQQRPTFVLRRGEYDKPGEQVSTGLPTSLGPVPVDLPNNRLGLAQWLVSRDHPLTSRVAVNRFWQMLFGAGLVRTVEDFGSQGQPPTHPELLDWLALEFQGAARDPWSIKRLFREIMLSRTYRQSSRTTALLAAADPENRWLARGPRFRLPAETIRDQALAMSGLLAERVGGPSVKPYQPADLWKELATDSVYQHGAGADLYRRSIYTYWKRTVAPPTLVTFDAAAREACVVRENRTNTPLQALALLNENTFVEAARMMAERILRESADTNRLEYAFRLATGRRPRPAELQVLAESLAAHRTRYAADRESAERVLRTGEAAADPKLDPREVAAWTAVAAVLMNLDETLTKD